MAYKKEYRDSIIMDDEMKKDWNTTRGYLRSHPEKIMCNCKKPVEVEHQTGKTSRYTRIGHAVRIDKA